MDVKRHLFLTGERQVGKTTLINRLLARHPGWLVRGFRTYTDFSGGDAVVGAVYIAPVAPCHWYRREEAIAGIRRVGGRESFPEVFDSVGVRVLQQNLDTDLVIMDELGFMENKAASFQHAVLKTLQHDTPVLGVIKPLPSVFLDAVRSHPGVHLLTITPDNREELLTHADNLITAAVTHWKALR